MPRPDNNPPTTSMALELESLSLDETTSFPDRVLALTAELDTTSLTHRVSVLTAELDTARAALTTMALDLMTAEKVLQEREQHISALEQKIAHASEATTDPSWLVVLKDLQTQCERAEAQRGDGQERPSHTRAMATAGQQDPVLDGNTMREKEEEHRKEVDELKRLIKFYKYNSECSAKHVERLQREVQDQAAPDDKSESGADHGRDEDVEHTP